ncbi:Thymidylate kinase [Curvibacter sp. AEP1-3]|uniref:dTMP kinase n=1 Tax=Curvibacter sp. AEP1-3 TaxID=1844971 RepID=UPI000B3CAB0A|nr:dTMP kinase [Curvibacter sp. AEP1-3]ARV17341.1 Thymidylate kinase [Curvibacter sp. AEP1-3]
MQGLFISFEGIDGAGKSTHIDAVRQAFLDAGRTVTLTREPGGTPLAEQLRNMVLNDPMDAMTEALLVFAARRDHVQKVVVPALHKGDVVLCDRFSDASFAYQGAGRGFDWQMLETLEYWVQGKLPSYGGNSPAELLKPQTTIWFDLPPAVAAVRLAGARVPDKFESQPEAFFDQVAKGYARRATSDPARFARIDADQTPSEVRRDVMAALSERGYFST